MKKVLCILLCLALIGGTTLTVGCGGGGSSNVLKAFGAVLIIAAIASTGGAGGAIPAFAASSRADLRAAAQTKYEAVLYINDVAVATSNNLTISANGDSISLDEPFSYAVSSAEAEYKVIFRLQGKQTGFTVVGNATLTDGETKNVGSTADPIVANASSTADSITYDLWKENVTGASDKTYSDFISAATRTELDKVVPSTITDLAKILAPADTTDSFATAVPVATPIAAATPVPTTTTNRLSGNYRLFQYSAGANLRWVGVSAFTASGNTLSYNVLFDSGEDVGNTGSVSFTESDGLITLDSANRRAAVSPTGNFYVHHEYHADDPSVGIAVKLPTNATNALLNGDYRFYSIVETVGAGGANPSNPRFTVDVVRFDGNGNGNGVGVSQILNEDNRALQVAFTYSVAADGKVTSTNPSNYYYQVSADGNVMITAEYGSDYREFSIGVKIGSGMSTADLPSRCVSMDHTSNAGTPYSYSASYLGTISNGTVSFTDGKSEVGAIPNESGILTVAANGTVDKSDAFADEWASLSPDKELYVNLGKNNDDDKHWFTFTVKR